MKYYTNKYNLAPELVAALTKDRYTVEGEAESDWSVSSLVAPTQQVALKQRYDYDLIIRDVSDSFSSFVGSIIHEEFEKAFEGESDGFVERRLYTTVLDRVISGKLDHYHGTTIKDYKSTKAYKYQKKNFREWEIAQNFYAYLLRCEGYEVNELIIQMIITDWKKHEAHKPNYPPHQFPIIELELWSIERQKEEFEERVSRLIKAETLTDEELATQMPCSDDERWANILDWAVVKKGETRAYRKFATEQEAAMLIKEKGLEETHELVCRRSEPRMCIDYCDCANHCQQRLAETNGF